MRKNKTRFLSIILAFPILLLLALPRPFLESRDRDGKTSRPFTGDSFEMVVQRGHIRDVTCVAFSPRGRFIASGSKDNSLKLWNLDGRLIRNFNGHHHWVNSLAFSPDEKYLVSGAYDKTVRLWSLTGGEVIMMRGHDSSVEGVDFSPDGKLIASASIDRTVRLWNIRGETKQILRGHTSNVSCVAFSPDGKLIASGSSDRTIRLWRPSGECIRVLPEGNSFVESLAWSPDGRILAAGYFESQIRFWDTEGRCLKIIDRAGGVVHGLAFSPDGRWIAAGGVDGQIRLYSREGDPIRTIKGHGRFVTSVSISPDGRSLVSGSHDDTVRLWDVSGEPLKVLEGNTSRVMDSKISPDGTLLASASSDGLVYLWSMDGRLLKMLSGHSKTVYSVQWNPDSRILASGSKDGTICLWNRYGHLQRAFRGHSKPVGDLSWSPDGRLLASASFDNTIGLWSREGKPVKILKGHREGVFSVSFGPDGKTLASGAVDQTVRLWNIETGEARILTGHRDTVTCVAINENGKILASGSSDRTVRLWTTEGVFLRELRGHFHEIGSVAWSPDGKKLASASMDKTLRLWSARGDLIRMFIGHTDYLESVSFSPDGRLLVSGSWDTTTRLWNIESGTHAALVPYRTGAYIIFTPDGYWGGSRNGGRLVNISRGLKVFGVDQFALINNRPDIILKRLGIGSREKIDYYRRLHLKRLRKGGFSGRVLATGFHVPESEILRKVNKGKQVTVTYRLRDSRYPLKRMYIYVNDVPLTGPQGRPVRGKSYTGAETLELTAGENKIEISCVNARGAESYRAVTFTSYSGKTEHDIYFLGLGISRYKDPSIVPLRYAHKDAQDLEKAFRPMEGRGFRKARTRIWTDEGVTRNSIMEARKILQNTRTDDIVVLFIAGHGMRSRTDGIYYFLTHDADEERLKETAAPFSLLEGLFSGIPARRRLMLMDTCEAGELDEDIASRYIRQEGLKGIRARLFRRDGSGRGLMIRKKSDISYLYEKDRFIYNDLLRRNGAVVFSASRGDEVSYEHERLRNGFFTRAFLEGLQGGKADRNRDGRLSMEELKEYVMMRVPEMCRSYKIQKDAFQHPVVDRDNLSQEISFPSP